MDPLQAGRLLQKHSAMKKIRVKVETEKTGLFGKKKVTEYRTVKVDDKTYRRLMKKQAEDPLSFDELILDDDILDD